MIRPPLHTLRQRSAGLTLIELMVALAVFAVLGTLAYRGTSQLLDARQHIDAELARWRAIDRAFQIIENDLLQIVAPEITDGSLRPAPLQLLRRGPASELRLLRLAPGDGVEWVSFRHHDDVLDWGRSREHAPTDGDSDRLLDQVRALEWRFLADGAWLQTWPPTTGQPLALPAAIEIRLELADVGLVTRIHALR